MRGNDTCNGIRFFCKTNIELCKLYWFPRLGHFIKPDDGYGRTSEKWLVWYDWKQPIKRTKIQCSYRLCWSFMFFFSMFITNDVSLITFVPFAMLTLRKCNQEKLLIPVIIVQTLAANLGSMLTPIEIRKIYIFTILQRWKCQHL